MFNSFIIVESTQLFLQQYRAYYSYSWFACFITAINLSYLAHISEVLVINYVMRREIYFY